VCFIMYSPTNSPRYDHNLNLSSSYSHEKLLPISAFHPHEKAVELSPLGKLVHWLRKGDFTIKKFSVLCLFVLTGFGFVIGGIAIAYEFTAQRSKDLKMDRKVQNFVQPILLKGRFFEAMPSQQLAKKLITNENPYLIVRKSKDPQELVFVTKDSEGHILCQTLSTEIDLMADLRIWLEQLRELDDGVQKEEFISISEKEVELIQKRLNSNEFDNALKDALSNENYFYHLDGSKQFYLPSDKLAKIIEIKNEQALLTQKTKKAEKIQALYRGKKVRDKIVLPRQLRPLLGPASNPKLDQIAVAICQEIETMVSDPQKFQGKSLRFDSSKCFVFAHYDKSKNYQFVDSLRHHLEVVCWLEMSSDGKEINLLLSTANKEAELGQGTYCIVYRAENYEIPLKVENKVRNIKNSPQVLRHLIGKNNQELIDKGISFQVKAEQIEGAKVASSPQGRLQGVDAADSLSSASFEKKQRRYNSDLWETFLKMEIPLDFSAHPKMHKIEMSDLLNICHDLASTLEAMHQQNILHNDIMPRNVFLHVTPQGKVEGFLADFDFAIEKGKLGKLVAVYEYWDLCRQHQCSTPFTDCYGAVMTLGVSVLPSFVGITKKLVDYLRSGPCEQRNITKYQIVKLHLDKMLKNLLNADERNMVIGLLSPYQKSDDIIRMMRQLKMNSLCEYNRSEHYAEAIIQIVKELEVVSEVFDLVAEMHDKNHALWSYVAKNEKLKQDLQGEPAAVQKALEDINSHSGIDITQIKARIERMQATLKADIV